VQEAHDRMDGVEMELRQRFPGTEFLIHLDPKGIPTARRCCPRRLRSALHEQLSFLPGGCVRHRSAADWNPAR
jgi:hypothetical protein